MIQLQVLNRILASKDASILTANNFNADYFKDYKDEYYFIHDHITKYGNVPDLATFLDKFPNFDVIEVSESNEALIDRLYDEYKELCIADTVNRIADLVENEHNISKAVEVYKKGLDKIDRSSSIRSVDILKDTSRYQKYIDKTKDFKAYFVKTGFPELDQIITGWDRQEELATIVARTNVGKSWVLIKMAAAAVEQGLRVGLYSGEMSETKVGYRFDTVLGHISNGSLVHGNSIVQNEYKKYIDDLPNKYKGSLKVITPAMINGPAGVNALRAFIEKEKLDILFVDQHSLLEDDHRAKNPIEKAANISKDLKNLQVMKRMPIICVSQQNRTSTAENGVGTEHIAQSDRIGQDSTIVIFFEKKDNELSMKLVKSRDSENGKEIKYYVDLNRGIFTYMPQENDALGGKACEELKNRYEVEVTPEGEVF